MEIRPDHRGSRGNNRATLQGLLCREWRVARREVEPVQARQLSGLRALGHHSVSDPGTFFLRPPHEQLRRLRDQDVVGVKKQKPFPGRDSGADIPRPRNSPVGDLNISHRLRKLPAHTPGPVCAPIIDNNDFRRMPGLGQATFQRRADPLGAVEGRDDDACFAHAGFRCLSATTFWQKRRICGAEHPCPSDDRTLLVRGDLAGSLKPNPARRGWPRLWQAARVIGRSAPRAMEFSHRGPRRRSSAPAADNLRR